MPGLLDKMYEDGKYAANARQEKNDEASRKKAKEEKKRKREAEKLKKKKEREARRKKKPTFNDLMAQSSLVIILVVLLVLFGIYMSSCFLDIVLLSKQGSKFLKETFPDGEGVPYGKGEQGSGIRCKEIKRELAKMEPIDGVSVGGGRKKYVQKGGFDAQKNKDKPFLDSTKWGPPYSWIENDNFFMNGMGNYFKTFWQSIRGLTKKILISLNETLYQDYKTPTDTGEKIYDFLKFTMVLPFAALVISIIIPIANLVLLFWGAINNQTFLIVPLLIFAVLCIFLGWLAPPPFQYFWPWGLISLYALVFVFKSNTNKLSYFTKYCSLYKWMWCLIIALGWFIGIGNIWEFNTESNVFSGTIIALLFTGMLGLTNLV